MSRLERYRRVSTGARHVPRRLWRVLLLVLALIALAGCQVAVSKSEPVDVDWSRGIHLGKANLNGRPGLALSGGDVLAVWGGRRAQQADQPAGNALFYARLDGAGHITANGMFDLAVTNPADVQLIALDGGLFGLAWIDRNHAAAPLRYTLLDAQGLPQGEVSNLTPEGAMVDSYTLMRGPSGELDMVWGAAEGAQIGLFHQRLTAEGQATAPATLLSASGFDPCLRYDRQGRAHLVWSDRPSFGERSLVYAELDPAGQPLQSETLETFPLSVGLVLHPPALGLAGDQVYVFWSIERRGGGMSSPAAWSYVLNWPVDQPEARGPHRDVVIPEEIHLRYQPFESAYAIHELDPGYSGAPAAFVYMPATVTSQQDQLLTAFAVQMTGRTKSTVQIVLTQWAEGKMEGFQVAGRTRTSSLRPILLTDEQLDLHLIWIDTAGFGAYDVYYASTRADVRANLNRLTGSDVLAAVLTFIWGIAQALSFLPLAFVWVFIPIVLLVIYVLFKAEGRLDHAAPRIMLVLAMLCYTLIKYFFQPGWLTALPLPEGLPQALSNGILFAMPVMISVVSGLLTWVYAQRKSETASIFSAFAIFAVCDALITMVLYVPGILAE